MEGRRCPRFEHACTTDEGAKVWDAVQRTGGWTGGGMTPRRVDRTALHARLEGVPGWIIENLVDAFEPAALNAVSEAEKRRKRNRDEPGSSPEGEVADD